MEELSLTDLIALLATTVASATAALVHMRAKKMRQMSPMTDEEFWQSEQDIINRRVLAQPEIMSAMVQGLTLNVESLTKQVDHLQTQVEELRQWLLRLQSQSK